MNSMEVFALTAGILATVAWIAYFFLRKPKHHL